MKKIAVTRGSTNVFADLGYANSEEMLAKAQLVSRISDLIKQRRLTQSEAATLLNYGFAAFEQREVLREGESLGTVEIDGHAVPVAAGGSPIHDAVNCQLWPVLSVVLRYVIWSRLAMDLAA